MGNLIASNLLLTAILCLAVFGAAITAAMYCFLYATAPATGVSTPSRILGASKMISWGAFPFVLLLLPVWCLAFRPGPMVVLLCGVIAALGCMFYAIYITVGSIRSSSTDGQVGCALIGLHLVQWAIAVVATVSAAIIAALEGLAHA